MKRLLLLIYLLNCGHISAHELIFAYGPGNGPPFAITQEGQLTGGLFKDMGDALAKYSGLIVSYRHVPTKRAPKLLADGEINTLCMTHPDWVEGPDKLFWSQIIARDYDHLISLSKSRLQLKQFEDAQGLSIGAMTGYIYFPQFIALFSQGKATRRDFNNLQSLYSSLLMQRVDVVVDSLISVNYRKKTHVNYKNLQVSRLVVYQYDLYCAFNNGLLPIKKKLEAAVQAMLDDGVFAQIIDKYK